jgi:hypothetical protein
MELETTNYTASLTGGVPTAKAKATASAFFWLSAFYFVYCARPEDWVPGLSVIPLAKITGLGALWGLYKIGGLRNRVLRNLPIESHYLLALIVLLCVSAVCSPVWKTGAIVHTIDFSKGYIVWLLTFLLVTDFVKFRRIVFIQAASGALVCLVSVIKGHSTPRLEGVLGGMYGNANDLAFSIVICLPFCLAFFLTTKSLLAKLAWLSGMLIMGVALMMTASRSGFIDLVVTGSVTLWHFGIKGKRMALVVITLLLAAFILLLAGRQLKDRFLATTGEVTEETQAAYGSFEARKRLMQRALEGIEQYPLLGVGVNNFLTYSGDWHEVHMSYLEIAVEGGVFALVLYLLFISRGFSYLRKLRHDYPNMNAETTLFVGALHSSLIGFLVGALFEPVAYMFFPIFAVAYSGALVRIMHQQNAPAPEPSPSSLSSLARLHANSYAAG